MQIPRIALSSNASSHDDQVADVVSRLSQSDQPELAKLGDDFVSAFPEYNRLEWSGAWVDTDASGVDADYMSWAADWIEENTPVYWEDGEPYLDDVSDFLAGYVEAALWSSVDMGTEEPLDANHDRDDIAPETLQAMRSDVRDFVTSNREDLEELTYPGQRGTQYSAASLVGHDFWLTRNRHGAGFWDRGLGELGERLSEAARVYGGVDLYVGDDGLIYS